MYRFALRPKWIVSHLLVLVLVVVMVVLGLWQLRRLDDRRSANDLVTARLAEPEADIRELTGPADDVDAGDDLRFRLATATGRYVADDEVLVRNRSLNGAPGYWVLTPLAFDDGSAVLVNRGWIPFSFSPDESRLGTEPPDGDVTVTGIVRETVVAEGLQRDDPASGVLDDVARPDLDRIRQQLSYPILPVYLQLESQQPPSGDLPVPLDRPDLGEGPHLSYAFQWFAFTAIALVGYPLVLRRVARSEAEPRHSDVPVDYL